MAKEITKQVTKEEETEELANLSEEELDTEIVAKEQTTNQEAVVEKAKTK